MHELSRPAPRPRSSLSRAGALCATVLIGLVGCVPGNFRISGVGLSFGSHGFGIGVGGFGGLNNMIGSGGDGTSVDLDDPADASRLMAATFHNPIQCEDRIGLGWGQGFLDFATGACFACPENYSRADLTVPVTDVYACKQDGGGLYQAAESLGPQGCDVGTFQIDDACYSCPVDTVPSGAGDPGTACIAAQPAGPVPVGAPDDPGTSVTFN